MTAADQAAAFEEIRVLEVEWHVCAETPCEMPIKEWRERIHAIWNKFVRDPVEYPEPVEFDGTKPITDEVEALWQAYCDAYDLDRMDGKPNGGGH